MSFLGLFGASDRNAGNRTQEYADWYEYLEKYEENEEIRKEQYAEAKKQYKTDIANNEANLRQTEKDRIQQYEAEVEIQNYQFENAERAFNKSVEQADTQKEFNKIAQAAALMEQDAKKADDLLGVMFDENDTLLEHSYASTGLKVDRNNKLVQASFQEARNTAKFTGDMGFFEIERRKTRSESQVETQKAIIEGMKAAGAVRARGNAGRSSAKSALAVMAESGALRASIANGLMYAEQGIDLNIAQLKDMLILDQTMVMASRYAAENEFNLKDSKLEASLATDKMKLSASRDSIKLRDSIVRQNIFNARRQADIAAEAQVMLEPERMPAILDPREYYKEYDNPETEDYVELLRRPEIQPFPDYEAAPQLDYEKDFHYSRGREDAAMSNFGDALKIGGMAATAIGGIASIGAMGAVAGAGGSVSSGVFGITAAGAKTFGTIGASLTNLSSSFYPSYSR